MHIASKMTLFQPSPSDVVERLLSALLPVLLMIGLPGFVGRTIADWTPPESSVTPPSVLTVKAFAAQDLTGKYPFAPLVVGADGALYGSTPTGGTHGGGTLFKIAVNGTFIKLHDFNGADGARPEREALVLGSDAVLYGSTSQGGTADAGTLFKLEANGTFTKLHDFNGTDGRYPNSAMVVGPDGALYGSTFQGGAAGFGTLFKLQPNGTFMHLHDFNGIDGAVPTKAMVVGSDGALYGSTVSGGADDHGTLFTLETNGTFTKLHEFYGLDGSHPNAALVMGSDGAMYGLTGHGGLSSDGTLNSGHGTVFKLEVNGTFTKLHDFNGTNGSGPEPALAAGLDGALYGSTPRGGLHGKGTVFKMEISGTFTKLHDFSGGDGFNPLSALVVGADGTLYGLTNEGGQNGFGTLFKLDTSGIFTSLHDFYDGINAHPGSYPLAAMVVGADGALYGSTENGGAADAGTLFKFETNGTFTQLHDFSAASVASTRSALAAGTDGSMYGSTEFGGVGNLGTLFKLEGNGTFTNLHEFHGFDGAHPIAALAAGPTGALYGATAAGGTSSDGTFYGGHGTLFKLADDGTFTKLHDFTGVDGSHPEVAPLVVGPDGALYGSTRSGGANDLGTLFKLEANGVFTKLHDFSVADGAEPRSALVVGLDGALYGSAVSLDGGNGTLYKVATDGSFTRLHVFNGMDGTDPEGGLVVGPDGALYGSTYSGGAYGDGTFYGGFGTLFKLETNGNFTKLHDFNGTDGAGPASALVVRADGALYGAAGNGGTDNYGTLFKLETNGNFTKLHDFNGTDGYYPRGTMVVGSEGSIYGSTWRGGPQDHSVLFKLVLRPIPKMPVINWANPADIINGTPLDGTQLNATASFNGSPVAGTFNYNPPVGTVLPLGNAQTLSATFTPNDAVQYSAANATVSINVLPVNHPPVIGNSLPDSITGPFGSGF